MVKVVKKRRIRLSGLLVLLIILAVIVFSVYFFLNYRIKNIVIVGNKYISDDEIIDIANIRDYPKFFLTNTYNLEKKLKDNDFIKSVNVKRKMQGVFYIDIEEYDVFYKNAVTEKYVLSNLKEVESTLSFRVPILVNYIPNDKFEKLIEYTFDIDDAVFGKISEVRYDPNEYDKDRFLLYMDDGNSVYLTLNKFEMINYYNEVLPQLEGKKGILYLDSGNHFKIME